MRRKSTTRGIGEWPNAPDQFQRRLHLRRFEAMARLQLIHIQPGNHRQLAVHLRQRDHAQPRDQRLHDIAVSIELEHLHGNTARCPARGMFTWATGRVPTRRFSTCAAGPRSTETEPMVETSSRFRFTAVKIERNQIVTQFHL